jgi:L-ribulose-5-phosphate 3-epimerase
MSFTRRDLLAAGTVAAGSLLAGTALAQPAAAKPAGRFAGKIKKAVKYHMITEGATPLDKLKLLKDLGYDGVEPRASEKETAAIRKAAEATGVTVHGVVNSSNPDIAAAIDVAEDYGATSVLVTVPADAKGSYLENYRERQRIIRAAVPHAERKGIKILIENVWASFLNEPLTMARFVDECQSDHVGVYFDIGNNVRWGYAYHWIEVLGKRIGKLDVKEYSRELQVEKGLRAGFDVEIGEGSVDWPRVRDELAELDYTGWATAEVQGGGRDRLADVARRMDAVLALV